MIKEMRKSFYIPLIDSYKGNSVIKYINKLEQTQWISREEIKDLQEKKLRILIQHAYQNVPYYHIIFRKNGLKPEDIKTAEDLGKIPILTREELRNNFNDLIARNISPKKRVLSSTGGSTGEPVKFYLPKDGGLAWGAFWRALVWYGIERGDKFAQIWSHSHSHAIKTNFYKKIGEFLRGYIFLSAFDMSEKKLKYFANTLIKFKPKYLDSYPSAAYILAKYVKKKGFNIKLKSVITTAEKLYDYQRQTIEEAFGCKVFEYYGCGECLSMAYECPEHKDLHITSEKVIIETLKKEISALPGEMGSVVVTDLDNYVMPFIRYENGDMATISDEFCDCGRELPLMKSVEGRITDVIVKSDGFISSPIVTTIFKNLPIQQYQVIQEEKKHLVIKIIKDVKYSQKDTDFILKKMNNYLDKDVEINIDFTDNILNTKAGKQRVVISKVPFEI